MEGSLLKKLDDAVNHLRTLEREKTEAVSRAAALDQEIKELRGLISMAESKAEEILKAVPVSAGAKSESMVFPEPGDVKPPIGSGSMFQELPADKAVMPPQGDVRPATPMQNPADTKRRYTQVF